MRRLFDVIRPEKNTNYGKKGGTISKRFTRCVVILAN